jgi:ABC-type multidrug transport system fused ATPase/permease subunit
MYKLLGYLAEPESAVFTPAIWVALLFIGPNCRGVMFRLYLFVSTRLIVRLKISLVQEIFQKALLRDMNRMVSESSEIHNQNSEGQNSQEEPAQADRTAIEVTNLMSYDVDAITAARDIVLCSVAGPAVVSISIFLLYQMLGWPSLAGLAVMLMCLGIPMHFAQRLSITQTQAMKATDMRISRISECLQAIRTIKYFAWENAISNKIEDARQIEQGFMWKKALYIIAIVASGDLMPLLSLLVMFSCYVLSTGRPLTSAIAFTSVSLVDIIRLQFTLMSSITSKVSQAGVSLHRIDRYFTTSTEVQRHRIGPPSFKNATLSRASSSGFKLKNLSIDFIENRLNVMTRASGSGKSSLLLSLLGESILESGEVRCHRDVGYAAQSAWLQRGSIRNNIIFNGVFEQDRYESVLHACGLDQDIQHLPYADLTLIGENGFTLSGGQRQRVALARAIYSKSSVLLLDDIFSALDVSTAIHVYNQCFCTDLLQNRTIILVTQLPWIAREADFEVKLDRGVVTFADTKQNVLRIPISVSQFMPEEVRPTYDSGTMTPSSQHSVPTNLLTSSKWSKNFHSPERNFKGLCKFSRFIKRIITINHLSRS